MKLRSRLAKRVVPKALLEQRIGLVASGIDVMAHKSVEGPVDRRRPKLSVVMPVFNERATFADITTQLLAKEIAGSRHRGRDC